MDNPFQIDFKPTASPVAEQANIFKNIDTGYAGAIAGQAKVPDLINKYDQQYGVPQMQQQIQQGMAQYDALGNTINNKPNEIAQRSRESILNQGQKDRVVQAESAPLLQQQGLLGQTLSRQQANLGVAQGNAAKMVDAAQVQQQKELAPWLQQYSNENVMSSMRTTGWNFENQSELTRLITNAQNGITLSEGEKNRANDLAMKEKEFENNLKVQNAKNQNQPGSNYITAGAGTSIFDPSTGKFIGTAPYKPENTGGTYTPFAQQNTTPQPTKGFVPLTYGEL